MTVYFSGIRLQVPNLNPQGSYDYTGKKEDDGTGLKYFGARFYDAEVGRFIGADPAQDGDNWFVYCSDNPINRIDPNGLRDAIDGDPGTRSEFSVIRDYNSDSGYHIVNGGNVYPNEVSKDVANTLYTGDSRYLNSSLRSLQSTSSNNQSYIYGILHEINAFDDPTYRRNLNLVFASAMVGPAFGKRAEPQNLKEKLAIEEVISAPQNGIVLRIAMTDRRWPASEGWVKMARNVNGVEIHYIYNTKTGQYADFKFK